MYDQTMSSTLQGSTELHKRDAGSRRPAEGGKMDSNEFGRLKKLQQQEKLRHLWQIYSQELKWIGRVEKHIGFCRRKALLVFSSY